VMVYQEDVMHMANRLAGLSLADADVLRRGMSGKGRSSEIMRRIAADFMRGCQERGIEPAMAREVWRQMESFAGYAFCKAHSASYAVLSWKLAYLKAHYPAEFISGVLANGGGFYGAGAYVEEARRLGLSVLPPDVNHGAAEFTSRDMKLRVGLINIKGLSEDSVERIVEERRKSGLYVSLADLLQRTRIGYSEAESLIKVGAFGSLPFVRPELLWQLTLLRERKTQVVSAAVLPLDEPGLLARESVPRLPDYSFREKRAMEWELLGYPLSCHPLDLIEEFPVPGSPFSVEGHKLATHMVDSRQLPKNNGCRISIMGQLISTKLVRSRKSGKFMKFMSFSDRAGTFEATLFPDSYNRLALQTAHGGAYLVTGKVEEEFGAFSVVTDNLQPLKY